MTYIKFGPNADFETINNKIHDFFGEFPNIDFNVNFSFKPKVDYYKDNDNIYIDLEIPGIKKEDIKVSFKENILTVSGDKKDQAKNIKANELVKSERSFGAFSRSFQFTEEIDPDSINASFEDGVLKINVKKEIKKTNQEKEIKIK
ncbi:MAG: Hsp20/alpha crystallin family protein [Bacteroidetes bacterium]|nr:Hsp20/alpha crystallin family protein [Bacteroidota bacterium]